MIVPLPLVRAPTIVVDSYSNQSAGIITVGETWETPTNCAPALYCAGGQAFTVHSALDVKITAAKFAISQTGSGAIGKAVLFSLVGSYGTTATPPDTPPSTASWLAQSDLLTIAGSGSVLVDTFNFSGSNQFQMIANAQYGIGFVCTSGCGTNPTLWGNLTSPSGHDGNAWACNKSFTPNCEATLTYALVNADLFFEVDGNTVPPPVASCDFTWSPTPVYKNNLTTFTATTNGTSPTYSWSWGDGSGNSTGNPAAHTYTIIGTVTVTLIVNATQGTCTVTHTVTILDIPTPPVTPPTEPCFNASPWIFLISAFLVIATMASAGWCFIHVNLKGGVFSLLFLIPSFMMLYVSVFLPGCP